jgi:hypothetical protein
MASTVKPTPLLLPFVQQRELSLYSAGRDEVANEFAEEGAGQGVRDELPWRRVTPAPEGDSDGHRLTGPQRCLTGGDLAEAIRRET